MDDLEATRRSWNIATKNHNSHKGDQAQRLRDGEEILFDEELRLLGDISDKSLVHLQCNAGQDSLCLARHGATVTGVDMSDEAVDFAQKLSTDSGIPASFVRSELITWLNETEQRFDMAFTSYGTTGWLQDLDAWAAGVRRVLKPGGSLVYVEFHPLVWSVSANAPFTLSADSYFEEAPFREPVGDYVAESQAALSAPDAQPLENNVDAVGWQHGLAKVLQAVVSSGLKLERVQEWPYSNGCRLQPGLVDLGDRRWGWPEGTAEIPLMYGLKATKD